jgi:hypothetical protein
VTAAEHAAKHAAVSRPLLPNSTRRSLGRLQTCLLCSSVTPGLPYRGAHECC